MTKWYRARTAGGRVSPSVVAEPLLPRSGDARATALEISGVVVRYSGFTALDHFDLSVAEAEIHAIIGPNGAGKSTLFGVLTGEVQTEEGTVRLGGNNVTGYSTVRMARAGVAKMFQRSEVFSRHTVHEAVEVAMMGRFGGIARTGRRKTGRAKEEVERALVLTHLENRGGVVVDSLSLGDQRVVELAMCLATRPRVLLLDEPTAGMSKNERGATVDLIQELNTSAGLTVLISEHDMDVILGLAERVTVVVDGRAICSGPLDEVRQRSDVRDAYLG